MSLDDELRRVAEGQHCVLSRRQARDLGATPSAVAHRLAGPDWDSPTPRVLRLVGAPRTALQCLMIAVLHLAPGAVASHLSAAALWNLPGFGFGAVEVTTCRGRPRRLPLPAVLHSSRRLPSHHVTELQGSLSPRSLARSSTWPGPSRRPASSAPSTPS